ncbi:hypothetical protein XAC3810_460003 [Xanthomonas citri pv. citri]|uniref:Uncharacterized protein n=1 Tax=Xanthomonas citri pv. citri TaxID=611301 RepID=A0A0U5BUH3_XANCI|nr:hypothetical protein XAC9322_470005 [Xanthomonas citri pv. citri]CEE29492.1 hypothetical protein XAC3824_600006 [Xanthomonas citri pv. citri]CEE30996.1 hypothetical protein XAC1083_460004 [Xanthomonas citri pv. citri]CEE40267.1 hypothetical protein XAC3810_460003 [Xanthomonas citri pv. citri]CEE42465.1 hypothetical protein XAC902_640005 [Xanthomonas citri pv. citri]
MYQNLAHTEGFQEPHRLGKQSVPRQLRN